MKSPLFRKNIKAINSIYFIGIKGAAITALAEILTRKKIKITGSDVGDIFFTDALLEKIKAKVYQEFDEKHLEEKFDLIVHSTAYNKENNLEVARAIKKGLPILSYPEALGLLFNKAFGIAVCGTHGKTTTTAMLAEILKEAGEDPTALVGSKVTNWGSGSLSGEGRYFVIEADEYQNKLQFLNPKVVVVTNIDFDHPDFFKDEADYTKVFSDFFSRIPSQGFLVYSAEDENSKKIAKELECEKISFGEKGKPEVKITERIIQGLEGQQIKLSVFGKEEYSFFLKMHGRHNANNASAAFATALKLGIKAEVALKALEGFRGSERRFEKKGEIKGMLMYDDYAHHPQEIKATLKAAREQYPKKEIIVAFGPHTFSRTEKFLADFGKALGLASQVYVLEIYSSAREKKEDFKVCSSDLVRSINEQGGRAQYVKEMKDLAPLIYNSANKDSIFISMGAGDTWKVHELIRLITQQV